VPAGAATFRPTTTLPCWNRPKAFQPIDTQRLKVWDKVTNLTKTGKLTPEANVGQGSAPYKWMWCDENGGRVQGHPATSSWCRLGASIGQEIGHSSIFAGAPSPSALRWTNQLLREGVKRPQCDLSDTPPLVSEVRMTDLTAPWVAAEGSVVTRRPGSI
jgi:hypothetical protein